MKTLLATIATTAALAAGGTGLAPPAMAVQTTPGCVTEWEYYHVYLGQTRAHVRQVFATPGTQVVGYPKWERRNYRLCGTEVGPHSGYAHMRYDLQDGYWRMTYKAADAN